MDRRSALSILGVGLLAGCGGGGGSAAPGVANPIAGAPGSTAPATGAIVSAADGPAGAGDDPARSAESPTARQLQALSRDIACWGDSITDLYARTLQQVYPDRQVYNGGVIGETSMQIRARQTADDARKSWISILWYGHNNWTKDPVKADLDASIKALEPGNQAFIVLSMLNWQDSGNRGTPEYEETIRVNAELAAMYPDNFIDMRSHLVSLYNPNDWQDVQDFQNDLPPSSLRFDRIHLNDAGCMAVARKLQEFIAAHGW